MRYFLTINASRPVTTPGGTFEFEPVGQRGGSWFGVLAVDDSAASTLAGVFGVDEITQERFEELKKKTQHSSVSTEMEPNRLQRQPDPATPVQSPGNPLPTSENPQTDSSLAGIILRISDEVPPVEPLMQEPVKKSRRPKIAA